MMKTTLFYFYIISNFQLYYLTFVIHPNLKDEKKRLERESKRKIDAEIQKIRKLSEADFFKQYSGTKLNWQIIAAQIRDQSRALNVKNVHKGRSKNLAKMDEFDTEDNVQPTALKCAWENRLHPTIENKDFSKTELNQIFIFHHEGKSWIEIAEKLSDENRKRTPIQDRIKYNLNWRIIS